MDRISHLWIDIDIESEKVPSPVSTREQLLPFQKLSWENFERLCFRFASRGNNVVDCRLYGQKGQDQQGIDIYVRSTSTERFSTWQCKKYTEFKASDLSQAVDKFLEGTWSNRCDTFYFATSASLVPTQLAEALQEAVIKCRERNIEFIPFDEETFSNALKEHPDLIDDFFGRTWVEAFCGAEAVATLANRRLSRLQRLEAKKKLRSLYQTHFAVVDVGLPAASSRLKNICKPFAIQDRYVEPMVEERISTLELTRKETFSQELVEKKSEQKVHPTEFALQVREEKAPNNLLDWLSSVDKGVILGTPGLGKSAALRFITLDLLSDDPVNQEIATKWGQHLPVYIPFAFITRMISENEVVGIVDCCRAWFQKLSARKEDVTLLEEALDDCRLLIIVDGLDEWSNEGAAGTALIKLRSFIENRDIPAFVSARPLGYERLGGLGPEWSHGELMPFKEVEQYKFIHLWLGYFLASASPTANEDQAHNMATLEADSLMRDLKQEADLFELAEIPLLLSALICLRLEGRSLPQNRFDVLEAVTNVLIADQPLNRARASLQGIGIVRKDKQSVERGFEAIALAIQEGTDSEAISEKNCHEILVALYQRDSFRKSFEEAKRMADDLMEQATQTIGLLVEKHPGHIGLLHRSLQEHLAARQLARMSFDDLKQFFLGKIGNVNWQEILLNILHSIRRENEVDEILLLIQNSTMGHLEHPFRMILLTRALCGNLCCTATLAKDLSERVMNDVETSSWKPLRRSLLGLLCRGVNSDNVGEAIRIRISKWFPGKSRWRGGIALELAGHPNAETKRQLLISLFNASGDHERKDFAEAIGNGSKNWPELADELFQHLDCAIEPEIMAAIIHALAIGWPTDTRLSKHLKFGSLCKNEDVRIVSLIHLAKKGDHSSEVKLGLEQFCERGSRAYPWESELLETLCKYWPNDRDFKTEALKAAEKLIMPTKWDDRLALRYLIKAFPQDDQVASIIAKLLEEEDYLDPTFRMGNEWKELQQNFSKHPIVAVAALNWLKNEIKSKHNEMEFAHVAMIAGHPECKDLLLENLKNNAVFPMWPLTALIEIFGQPDSEVLMAAEPICKNDDRAGMLGDLLPHIITDKDACFERLLHLLGTAKGFESGHILKGLIRLDKLGDQKVLQLVEKRISNDIDGAFWWGAKYILIKQVPQLPAVKNKVIGEIDDFDFSLTEVAHAYSKDADIRPLLEGFLSHLDKDLRLQLVQSLEGQVYRNGNPFVLDTLRKYTAECSGEVRVAAADIYYSAIKKIEKDFSPYYSVLEKELAYTGSSYSEHHQSAVAGLLILDRSEILKGTSKISFYDDTSINWKLMRVVISEWEKIKIKLGNEIWDLFDSEEKIISELSRAGRKLIFEIPETLKKELERNVNHDVASFRALAALQKGSDEMLSMSLRLLSAMIPEDGKNLSWGYQTMEVINEVAHYLGENHYANLLVGQKLEYILERSSEKTGPVIALCVGWPNSAILQKAWTDMRGQKLGSSTATAWLVCTKGSSHEFFEFLLNISNSLRDEWIGFPAEKLKAIRRRLSRDKEVQRLIIEHLKSASSSDANVALVQLMGTYGLQIDAIKNWVSRELSKVITYDVPSFSKDIFRGYSRPTEFCLLESCLLSRE